MSGNRKQVWINATPDGIGIRWPVNKLTHLKSCRGQQTNRLENRDAYVDLQHVIRSNYASWEITVYDEEMAEK